MPYAHDLSCELRRRLGVAEDMGRDPRQTRPIGGKAVVQRNPGIVRPEFAAAAQPVQGEVSVTNHLQLGRALGQPQAGHVLAGHRQMLGIAVELPPQLLVLHPQAGILILHLPELDRQRVQQPQRGTGTGSPATAGSARTGATRWARDGTDMAVDLSGTALL